MMKNKLKKQSSQQKKDDKLKPALFEKINRWFDHNHSGLMVTLCVFSFLFSLLLFDIKISEGGDDATYIEGGFNYAKNFFNYHFTYNAPLYPMVLSIIIKFFGINLKLLKFTSVIFTLLHLIFLFFAFFRRIPNVILFPVLFIISINSFFQYHASQTYNEAFFLWIQALFFFASFRLIEKTEKDSLLSNTYKHWLFFGFISFVFALSKNIAVLGLGSVIFYFLLNKKFQNILYTLISFAIFRIPYEIFSYLVWIKHMQYSSQMSVQLLKDAYHPEKGNEDLAGFISRFFQNADLYFSRRLMHILNIKPETNNNLNHSETILVTALLLFGLFAIFKSKNKYLFITFFYLVSMIAATFLLLQITWDQPRLILIFVPFILVISLWGLYYFADFYRKSFFQFLFCSGIIIMMFLSLSPSLKKIKTNLPVLKKNIHGDMYFGYTSDWANFLKMSEWCAKNLPDTAFIVSRKPSMSFIYSGGKKFYPVFMVTTTDADSVLIELKENKVTHALIANLRKDKSKIADSTNVINTVHRMLKPVVDKYPGSMKLVHKIGDKEPAYLLSFDYSVLQTKK